MRSSRCALAMFLPIATLLGGACDDDATADLGQASATPLVMTLSFEAEDLARTSSFPTKVTDGDCENSRCAYVEFEEPDVAFLDDWIQLTLPNLEAGTYGVRLVYKANDNRGILQASMDGKALGKLCDEYSDNPVHQASCDLGQVTIAAGTHGLRFRVVDVNDFSWGFAMTLDAIVLTRQTTNNADAGMKADSAVKLDSAARLDGAMKTDSAVKLDSAIKADGAWIADGALKADSSLVKRDGPNQTDGVVELDARDALGSDGPPASTCRCLGKPLPACVPTGSVSYKLARSSDPTPTEESAYAAISCAMEAAVAYYNCNTTLRGRISVAYRPGVPTAQASYMGEIAFGAKRAYMACSTAMHEMGHYYGVGTHWKWKTMTGPGGVWTGSAATGEMRRVTNNPNAVVHISGAHFWPYGLNYASEVKTTNDLVNHTVIVSALRRDMGL